jgi:hypothetical protein
MKAELKPVFPEIKKWLRVIVFIPGMFLFNTSCEKPPGPGGRATIKGKVYAYDYDNTQRYKLSEGYSPGEKVYIIYGNNTAVGKDVRTSMDGSYQFQFLNKGHYKVFVTSIDTSLKVKGNNTDIPISQDVNITESSQVVTLKDFVINK